MTDSVLYDIIFIYNNIISYMKRGVLVKIVIGCDEAGCGLKHIIIDLLQKEGIEVTDEDVGMTKWCSIPTLPKGWLTS